MLFRPRPCFSKADHRRRRPLSGRRAPPSATPIWLPELGTALDRAGATDSALAVYQEYLGSTFNFRIWTDAYNLAPVLRRTGELYEARGDRSAGGRNLPALRGSLAERGSRAPAAGRRGEAQARRADGGAALISPTPRSHALQR